MDNITPWNDHLPATGRHDPRDDWHREAKKLREKLEEIYGPHDTLSLIAGAWLTRQRSAHTRKAYARHFLNWDIYVRSTGGHPLSVHFPLADAYANLLEKTEAMQRVKGGQRGEMEPSGKPLSDSSRAQALAACGSFYRYAERARAIKNNPFSAVPRPYIDPDYSPTEGILPQETAKLLTTAKRWSPRSYALLLILYLIGPRIDEVLKLNADQIMYDRGHQFLPLYMKGGKKRSGVLAPLAMDALITYLSGRSHGPLFSTSTGLRWTEPQVWSHMRVLARHAGIPQANSIKPHMLRHAFGTDSLEAGVALHIVQDSMGHTSSRTTQRYNRRRKRLENHPAYTLAQKMAEMLEDPED